MVDTTGKENKTKQTKHYSREKVRSMKDYKLAICSD